MAHTKHISKCITDRAQEFEAYSRCFDLLSNHGGARIFMKQFEPRVMTTMIWDFVHNKTASWILTAETSDLLPLLNEYMVAQWWGVIDFTEEDEEEAELSDRLYECFPAE